jgi:hypothetical protein
MPLLTVRYGLPLGLFLLGIVFYAIEPNTTGFDGFCTATGAALALLLLNVLFRTGVSGDREREDEEAARAYYDEHGRWPDEDAGRRVSEPRPEPAAQPRRQDGGARAGVARAPDGGGRVQPSDARSDDPRRHGGRARPSQRPRRPGR